MCATARIAQPTTQHRRDAQRVALVRGAFNHLDPCALSKVLSNFPPGFGDKALASPLQGLTDE